MGIAASVDRLLRGEGRSSPGGEAAVAAALAAIVAGGFLYGAVMGSYGIRPLQSLYSGLKVPLLLAVSTALCLPSFYVLYSLLGLRRDFAEALGGILAGQAALAVVLAALAPITAFVYVSKVEYAASVAFNGVQFLAASLAGQMALDRRFRPLIRRNRRHRIGRAAWLILYVFVAIQMAWVLRPFIGSPDLPTGFFRPGAWSNAYVEVLGIVLRALGGR